MKLKVTITKTATGQGEYIQVMSDDKVSVNFVSVAEEIEVFAGRSDKAGKRGTIK